MKICPKCGASWPDVARFCPQDGSPLKELPSQASAPSKPPEQPAEQRVSPPIPAMPKAPSPPPPKPPDPAASTSRKTVQTPAPPAADRSGKKPGPEEEDGVDDWGDEGGGGGDGAFSDTQWFMAAVDPEALKESASVDELNDLQTKYRRDESIPDEVRKKFSLREDNKNKK